VHFFVSLIVFLLHNIIYEDLLSLGEANKQKPLKKDLQT